MNLLKKYLLEITTFTSGFVIMTLELVGSRVVAPYLGTSTIVWTSLIGIILASLSFGYWLGGKIADKYPLIQNLGYLFLSSSFFVLVISYFSNFIGIAITDSLDIYSASVLITILLFSPATILLGMISPYVLKLKLKNIETSGSNVGNLYAISTFGSILGTFSGGFFLISFLKTNTIIQILSLVLFIMSIILLLQTNKFFSKKILILLSLPILYFFLIPLPKSLSFKVIDEINTKYSRFWIYETQNREDERPIRIISNSSEISQSGMYLDNPNELVFKYTKSFSLDKVFVPNFRNTLHLGAGGFSYPKYFIQNYPNAKMDLVEIDEKMLEISEKYFAYIPNENINFINQDARIFLNKNQKKYDVIYVDAFSSKLSIPYNLATKETVEKLYNALDQNGVIITNVISGIETRNNIIKSMYKTYLTKFPNVKVYKTSFDENDHIQNLILVASKKELKQGSADDIFLKELLKNEVKIKNDGIILTDNFVPVEKFLAEMQF